MVVVVHGKECQFPRSRFGYSTGTDLASNQTGIDELLKDCTTLIGEYSISRQYTGSLSLRNIVNITGSLDIDAVPGLTGLVAENLEYVDLLYTQKLPAITLRFPKLKEVRAVNVGEQAEELYVDFPVLRTAEYVSLGGFVAGYVRIISLFLLLTKAVIM